MTSNAIRYITAGMALASGILALGDKVTAMPGMPGWLTSSWPLILAGAGVFNHVAHILITPAQSVSNKPSEGVPVPPGATGAEIAGPLPDAPT